MKYEIKIIIDLLAQSIGVEAAEKTIDKAIIQTGLPRKTIYSEEEFQKICDALSKEGGLVSLFAKLITTPAYRETYFRIAIEKEKKEREKIENLYRELSIAYQNLEKMQQEVIRAEKLAVLGKFASAIAHELRNPLSTMKNISFYLKNYLSLQDETAKSFIELLHQEVERASKIVNELLEFTRTKKLELIKSDIIQLIEEIIPLVEIPSQKNIEIKREYSKEKIIIDIDPNKIKQVMINLLQNAVEAITSLGVITITVEELLDKIIVVVKDTGCGMDEETKKRIFEPLFTTKTKGIGLGLSIVKEIISAHKGTIEVESEINKGTSFKIIIPKN
ncbi:MAG: ATP-binding protein [Endomicrobia bacterium]|nr:ATP-binding protein [Endomicrobiia bacterium]